MPQWIHNRAEHLLAKNPSMDKSTAFAIATQQSHAKGKSPKGYGTKQGRREAKAKYNQPKRKYEGKANPGKLESPKMAEALAQQLIRAGRLLPEEVIAPQIRAGEQRFAQHMTSKLSPRARAMFSETPMGRAGTPPAMMAQLAGTSDMDAQRALMGVWDNTTPVHATAKAASIDPYYFMLDALEKSAFDMSAAMNGLRVAGLPALGGALGGAVAGGFGVDPLTGEVLGAALGATPAVVRAIRAKRAATLAVPDAPKVASITPTQNLKQTQEAEQVKKKVSPAKAAIGGTALSIGSGAGGLALHPLLISSGPAESALPGSSELFEAVKAKSQVPILEGRAVPDNAFFVPNVPDPNRFKLLPKSLRETVRRALDQTPLGTMRRHALEANVDPSKPFVYLYPDLKQPSILAHELGHSDLHHGLGRLLQNKGTMIGGNLGRSLAGIGGLTAGLASDDPTVQALGASAGTAAMLPMLGFEGLASMKGMGRLRDAGATPEQLAMAAKRLRMAYGTYGLAALGALGSGVAGMGIGSAIRGVRKTRASRSAEPAKVASLTPAQRLKQTQEVGQVKEIEPKDTPKLTKFKPIGIKLAFTESEFSGGLGPYAPFISRGYSFQSSLPGNPNKYAGPDPEEEEGDPEHFPSKDEKSASLWKAAHFACSAVGAWEERQRQG